MSTQIHICPVGIEAVLARELESLGSSRTRVQPGFVEVDVHGGTPPVDLCHATLSLDDAVVLQRPSVNALAGALCDAFGEAVRGRRIDSPWPLHWQWTDEALSGRCRSLAAEFAKRLGRRLGRVAKLASSEAHVDPAFGFGLGVLLTAPDCVYVATSLRSWGQRRMRMHPQAPSRSFLKLEEAFWLMGAGPGHDETAVDLGAAPGGWSFSAAERGATVWAVDNGPLKGAAKDHPRITHRREDAFGFRPPAGRPVDWLLCDLIESPARVMDHILVPWLDLGLCRRFVVNLKVGRHDVVDLLQRLRGRGTWSLTKRCDTAIVRHLYHDREEITCMGAAHG